MEFSGTMFSQEAQIKQSRFSETQIVSILKEADTGIQASDLKRRKELETELSQYKRMYAELARENDPMRNLIEKKL